MLLEGIDGRICRSHSYHFISCRLVILPVKCLRALISGLIGNIPCYLNEVQQTKPPAKDIKRQHMWCFFLWNSLNTLVDGKCRSLLLSASHSCGTEPSLFLGQASVELLNGGNVFLEQDLTPMISCLPLGFVFFVWCARVQIGAASARNCPEVGALL